MSALFPPPGYETAWLWLNLLLWLAVVPGLMWIKSALSMAHAVRCGCPIHAPWLLAAMILPCMLLGLLVVAVLKPPLTDPEVEVYAPLYYVLGLGLHAVAAFVAGEKAWLS